jgi:hypothetical protein
MRFILHAQYDLSLLMHLPAIQNHVGFFRISEKENRPYARF